MTKWTKTDFTKLDKNKNWRYSFSLCNSLCAHLIIILIKSIILTWCCIVAIFRKNKDCLSIGHNFHGHLKLVQFQNEILRSALNPIEICLPSLPIFRKKNCKTTKRSPTFFIFWFTYKTQSNSNSNCVHLFGVRINNRNWNEGNNKQVSSICLRTEYGLEFSVRFSKLWLFLQLFVWDCFKYFDYVFHWIVNR